MVGILSHHLSSGQSFCTQVPFKVLTYLERTVSNATMLLSALSM